MISLQFECVGRPNVVAALVRAGVACRELDTAQLIADGIRWYRIECNFRNAQAIVVTAEEPDSCDGFKYILTVSLDIRRFLVPWRLFRDYSLVAMLTKLLKDEFVR